MKMQLLPLINCQFKKTIMKNNLICFITILCLLSCKKDNKITNNNTSGTDNFPNKVGDTWVYHVKDTTVSGFLDPVTSIEEYDLTVSVIDSIVLASGQKANIWVSNYPGGTDTNYVFQKGDTVYFKVKSDYTEIYTR